MTSWEAVRARYEQLPARVHTDDPRTVYSRILAGYGRQPGYNEAVHLAALALALVEAVDRAETASITTGDAA